MSHDQLLHLSTSFFNTRPSLLHDCLLRLQEPTESLHQILHPVPKWCKCTLCQEMPNQKERKCCGRKTCVTKDQAFFEVCLNGINLEVAIRSRADIYVSAPTYENKSMRHIAYRQFVMWQHGPLGAGNRVVIPSCAVWKIRRNYPSANGQYTGYKDR